MSSAYLLLQRPSLGAVRWSQPPPSTNSSDSNSRHSSLWRPWLSRPESNPHRRRPCPYSQVMLSRCCSSEGKPQAFQHPVRLFWPKSKSFDYLYSDGEALLRNFPVQATISFYEETDSENEDDDEKDWEEEEEDSNTEESVKQRSYFTSCS